MRLQISDKELNQIIFSSWKKISDGVPMGSVLGSVAVPYIHQ
jgi:hypothetical protein